MQAKNIIGIYSNVITDPSNRHHVIFNDDDTVSCGPDTIGTPEYARIAQSKTEKHVLCVSARTDAELYIKYPALHPYFDKHEHRTVGSLYPEVRGNVCVHTDQLISDVIRIRCDIATNAANAEVARLEKRCAQLQGRLGREMDEHNALILRGQKFLKRGVFNKLLHVVISWFKGVSPL